MPSKKTSIKVIKQNVGVDISKDDFKVCFYRLDSNGRKYIKGSRTFKNTLAGFREFLKWIKKHQVEDLQVRFTIEATGIYHENLVYFLDDAGYFVSVILANQSNSYAKSLNLKTKTDKVDAKMLGQMGIERELFQWRRLSPNMRIIKQLTRDRVNLLNEKTMILNKMHALSYSFDPNKQVVKRFKQRKKLVEKQLKEVEKQIHEAVKKDEILKPKIDKICKVKGLGVMTVATVIAETNGFKLFTSRGQIVSYAGYDVVEKQSGSSIYGKTKISKKGNRYIRRALHFPALTVIKYDTNFRQLFDRVLDRTAIKMKAYVAVQRKLLVLIYTLFKNDIDYNSDYNREAKNVDRQQSLPTLDACH